jgi:putative transposase
VLAELAVRQGGTSEEAEGWAAEMTGPIPWSMPAMRKHWNHVKDDVAPWWSENSKEAYNSGFEALAAAFRNYFESRDGARKGPKVGWPKKKKRKDRQSVSFTTGAIRVIDRHHIQLPVLGVLRVHEPTDKLGRKLDAGQARIQRATLSVHGHRIYCSFGVIAQRGAPANTSSEVCGTDVGITHLAVSSDGRVTPNPRALHEAATKRRRYQRRLDRQHRTGSPVCFGPDGRHIQGDCQWHRDQRSRRARQTQRRLARLDAHCADVRSDTIHKLSHRLAATKAVNVIEDLAVSGMGRKGRGKRGYNQALADAALAELRRQLAYKHTWYGSQLWLASRWYPSSKTCSACGTLKTKLSRSSRLFDCPTCGLRVDRDLNAANNLARLGELAGILLVAQLVTGIPVDWSKAPLRPAGWEPKQQQRHTRSSRESARAGGPPADGAATRPSPGQPQGSGGGRAVDREAAGAVTKEAAA